MARDLFEPLRPWGLLDWAARLRLVTRSSAVDPALAAESARLTHQRRANLLVDFAPLRPAEFILIDIAVTTG